MVRVKPLRGGGIAYRFVAVTAALASIGLLVPLMFAGPSVPAYAEENTAGGTTAATTVETEDPKGSGNSEQVKAGSESADSAAPSPSTPTQNDAASQAQGSEPSSGTGSGEQADNTPAADDDSNDPIHVEWSSVNGNTQKLDNDGVNQVTPTQTGQYSDFMNGSMALQAKFTYNLPTVDGGYPAGSVNITVPKALFDYTTSQNNKTGSISLGVEACSSGKPTDGMCWKESADGKSYVITNTEYKPNGKGNFTVTYAYKGDYDYWAIPNGSTASIKPVLETNHGTFDGNEIKAQWNSGVTLDSATKTNDPDKTRTTWDPAWGEQPKEVQQGDWFYTLWTLRSSFSTNGHRFNIAFTDTPNDGGVLVASSGIMPDNRNSCRNISMTADSDSSAGYEVSDYTKLSSYDPQSLYQCVVVAYPMPDETVRGKTFHNHLDVSLNDGETEQKKTAEAEFDYKKPEWTAPAGCKFDLKKTVSVSESNDHRGDLDRLRRGDESADLKNFTLSGSTSCGDKDSYPSYTSALVDNLVSLDNTLLEDGDYEYISYIFSSEFSLQDLVPDLAAGSYKPQTNTDWKNYPTRTLYGRKIGSKDWVKLATCIYSDSQTCSIDYMNADAGVSKGYASADGSAVKFTGYAGLREEVTAGSYAVNLSGEVTLRILPSSTVKKIVNDRYSQVSQLEARNYDTLDVKDTEGKRVGFYGNPVGNPTDVQQKIEQRDQSEYGTSMYHGSASVYLGKYSKTSVKRKSHRDPIINNTSAKRFEIAYQASFSEGIQTIQSNSELEKLIREGLFSPQKEGIFYDLLPQGMSVDKSTIRVQDENYKDAEILSTEFNSDWQGTGRTLMTVKVKAKSENVSSGDTVYSGLKISYTGYYDWTSVKLYGNDPVNLIAYETGNENISLGYGTDNELNVPSQYEALLPSLLDAGSKGAKFLYTENSATVQGDTSAWLGLAKSVKAVDSATWGTGKDTDPEVSVEPESGEYQYRLAYTPDTSDGKPGSIASDGKVTNMVLYDSLESCPTMQFDDSSQQPSCSNTWKGVLRDVDLSQPKGLGANPTVYISTKPDLDLSGKTDNKNRDVTNSDIWTKVTDPTDADALKNATAVAIDFGSSFSLPADGAISVILTMKAPKDYSSGHAYNQTWLTSKLIANGNTSEVTNAAPIGSNYTQVGLERPVFPVAALPLTGGIGSARWWMLAGGGFGLLAALAGCSYHVWRRRRMV